jgi:flagellar basal-body rod protein FlgF
MENISYVGLSQQMALQREMEITANNLANMDTPGYKSEGVLFLSYLNKAGGDGEKLKQVQDYGVYRDLSGGTLKQTFNKLDVAIQGDGYFAVQAPDGVRYTRAGSFSLNANYEIVNKDGYTVMDEGGGAITLPSDATDITITPQGQVSTDKGTLGKIKVVTFANAQNLKPVGGNLYDAGKEAEIPAENPRVEQGMIESSNVNAVVEMNKMIEISRMYQAAQRMLLDDHQRQLGAIQKLTQVS